MLRSRTRIAPVAALAAAAGIVVLPGLADAAKSKKAPVVAVVSEGIAEKLHGAPKLKKGKKAALVGRSFPAVCDGAVTSWRISDLADDGAWVGGFVGGAKPHRCLLVDGAPDSVTAAKGRPNVDPKQIAAARLAATVALTPKKGTAADVGKLELQVFHDGVDFVAVAQTQKPATGKSSCLDRSSLVVMVEDGGSWKTIFRPAGKGKDICGYTFFSRGDVDADGRDEIALRVDKTEGYGYRVLKRVKGSYSVIAR